MLYLQLFLSFFKIGLFGFGGGLAILSLIQIEVETHAWMTNQEFVDIVAVSQVTPGPIGINCATYVGYTATGTIWGSILATFAVILPSLIIMLSICRLYNWLNTHFQNNPYWIQTLRMLRFTVIGLIAAAALLLMRPTTFIDSISWGIFAFVALCSIIPKTDRLSSFLSHPIVLIVVAGIAGYFIYT
ncbi:MAG: chromate transporter [Paludibacteraceae bacterium]|nr:chromate transporter [Paludibacteraceae bacterium]